ncbi:hypothetical protein [Sphingomonas montanisoli]|uniref:Lipoprotein n=1 Tax=Sphingomonas montanisoli TaxID=2606412 RepID=A0A5D9C4U9_9SPHN|nr:hypothetical protein [Sphingomonas montanisoli]TZG26050.1 hypothetical protein FYJ91_13875 [Sphingomonas montanisoli]
MMRRATLLAFTLLSACTPQRPAPPRVMFDGVPIAGSLADAHKAGFTACIADNVSMRCRRPNLMMLGQGPYSAAIDLVGSDGGGGFDRLSIWHDSDQNAVLSIGEVLKQHGWHSCLKGSGGRGEVEDYTRPGSPVRVSIEISYWGKRPVNIIREAGVAKPAC